VAGCPCRLQPARHQPTGNLHGMPVASLCGHGPAPLAGMAGFTPALQGQTSARSACAAWTRWKNA
jgi:hypothetical protein